ncbi:MAG: DUF3794 domain-containing protein [Firmicutes bacterium]|nr:DUF3794 domain-containing protein [Bacillota bacterium]
MPERLQVNESIATRTSQTRVSRNLNIPSTLPAAARIVSANARVEITDTRAERGVVVISGIIRVTVYYASLDDPSNVVSVRRSFTFTDREVISGVRPGYQVDVESLISDIDFELLNDRLIELEFTVVSDIEVTTADVVTPIGETPDFDFRRRRYTIQRRLRERNFTRELESVERLPSGASDIDRIIDVDSTVQIIDVSTGYDRVTVRGTIRSNLLYVAAGEDVEYSSLSYGFNETFPFSGVTPEMNAFVDTSVISESAQKVDNRRVRINTELRFQILVVLEETVELPTDIISPVDGVFPVRRTVIVERIVAEERTRIQARDQVTVAEGNPDVGRVISASGNIRGASLEVEAQNGGVLISGVVDANIIYVADLPDQPVYFAPAVITFSSFINIPQVTSNMEAYADISINRITANRASERQITVIAVLDVNLVVTERVRVPIITGISEQPIQEPTAPSQYITYTVKSGDTLYLIAQRFGVTVNRITSINNITDPGELQIGQRLLIPRG